MDDWAGDFLRGVLDQDQEGSAGRAAAGSGLLPLSGPLPEGGSSRAGGTGLTRRRVPENDRSAIPQAGRVPKPCPETRIGPSSFPRAHG